MSDHPGFEPVTLTFAWFNAIAITATMRGNAKYEPWLISCSILRFWKEKERQNQSATLQSFQDVLHTNTHMMW